MINGKEWIIFDEEGELVICTDLQDTINGYEYNPIAKIDYYDAEEFVEYMKTFTEICKAHNDSIKPNSQNKEEK